MNPADFQTPRHWLDRHSGSRRRGADRGLRTLKGKIDDLQAKHEQNAKRLDIHDSINNITTKPFDPCSPGPIGSTTPLPEQGMTIGGVEYPDVVKLPDPKAFRHPLGQPGAPK